MVNQRWHLVPDEKRRLIRIALKDGLVKFHKSHESDFLIVKICKVIADIGRLELNLPEYFDFVKQVILNIFVNNIPIEFVSFQLIVSNDKGMSCGLRLLKITLEEWAATNNSRCYLYSSTDAKKAMKLFAETQLSSIYAILTGKLRLYSCFGRFNV